MPRHLTGSNNPSAGVLGTLRPSALMGTMNAMKGEAPMQSRLMTLLLLIIALNGGHALAHGSPAPPGQEDPSGPQTTRGLMSEEVLQHKLATQGTC